MDEDLLARGLGYLVGAGSLLLYTPIAVKVLRQGHADGLTLSTWWLKLWSYTFADVYAFAHGYPLSQYIETLILTLEAAFILLLCAYMQRRIDAPFAATAAAFAAATAYGLSGAAPGELLSLAQAGSTLLNTGALLPQIALNARRRSAGDYSPITAGLACAGCLIRLFTTTQLADGDTLLLAGFGSALLLNGALLAQVLWLGTREEGRSLAAVLTQDFAQKPAMRVGAAVEPPREEEDRILSE